MNVIPTQQISFNETGMSYLAPTYMLLNAFLCYTIIII